MQTEESVGHMFDAWLERTENAKRAWQRTEALYLQGRALEVEVERDYGLYLGCRGIADMLSWVIQKEIEIP